MKIVDDYLEVTDPEIAVLFRGMPVFLVTKEAGIISKTKLAADILDHMGIGILAIRIPKETVKKVCEAKKGDSVFMCLRMMGDIEHPYYTYPCRETSAPQVIESFIIKANALTIGKTVGELRELWEWINK